MFMLYATAHKREKIIVRVTIITLMRVNNVYKPLQPPYKNDTCAADALSLFSVCK